MPSQLGAMDKEETKHWMQELAEATAVTACLHRQRSIEDMRDALCELIAKRPLTSQDMWDTSNGLRRKNSEKWARLFWEEDE